MEMYVYVGTVCVAKVCGCEFVGEVYEKAKALADLLGESCALVSAETGEVLVLWQPTAD